MERYFVQEVNRAEGKVTLTDIKFIDQLKDGQEYKVCCKTEQCGLGLCTKGKYTTVSVAIPLMSQNKNDANVYKLKSFEHFH